MMNRVTFVCITLLMVGTGAHAMVKSAPRVSKSIVDSALGVIRPLLMLERASAFHIGRATAARAFTYTSKTRKPWYMERARVIANNIR